MWRRMFAKRVRVQWFMLMKRQIIGDQPGHHGAQHGGRGVKQQHVGVSVVVARENHPSEAQVHVREEGAHSGLLEVEVVVRRVRAQLRVQVAGVQPGCSRAILVKKSRCLVSDVHQSHV